MVEAASGLELRTRPRFFLGTLRPGTQVTEYGAVVDAEDPPAQLLGRVRWRNADGIRDEAPFEIEFSAQRNDIDWGSLEAQTPYLLTAIEDPRKLVGRDQLLQTLTAAVRSESMSSAVISGQKRVGKTSIALTLRNKLLEEHDDPAYLSRTPRSGSIAPRPEPSTEASRER